MTGVELQSGFPQSHRHSWFGRRTLLAVMAVAILVAIGRWFCVAVRDARDAAIACQAQSHLNQLQLALCNYHAMHGCFPPAYLADTNGKPAHSWRVLILPFIEQEALYRAYRFDEPWNGPNNFKLVERMPQIFHMPSEPDSTSITNIVTIVGPDTAFPGSKSTRIKDFTDGLDQTILLTEIAASDIAWLEPRDLRAEEMSFTVNDKEKPSISCSRRRRGPYVVFADSISAYEVSRVLRPQTLKALTTIAGGEKVRVVQIPNIGLVETDSETAQHARSR